MKKLIEEYPKSLDECFDIFEKIEYETYGFPMIQFVYLIDSGTYSMSFRNPKNFNNPNHNVVGKLNAAHKMIDFINENSKHFKYIKK